MSDQIVLTGIHGFGYHGLFDHERKDNKSIAGSSLSMMQTAFK